MSTAPAKALKSLLKGHLANRARSLNRKNFRFPEGNTRRVLEPADGSPLSKQTVPLLNERYRDFASIHGY